MTPNEKTPWSADQLNPPSAKTPSSTESIPGDDPVRTYYLKLAEHRGIDEALTALHLEVGKLEPKVFDGGFSQEKFDRVQNLRVFARELWNMKLREKTVQTYGEAAAKASFGPHISRKE